MFQKPLAFIVVFIHLSKLVSTARKCHEDCNTAIKLKLPTQHLKIVQNITAKVIVTTVEEEIEAFVGFRKYRNKLVLNEFGIWPEINEIVHMVPDKKELVEWESRGECKIGRSCSPKGHCWGTDAAICKSNVLTTWVTSSHFEHMDVDWNKDLFRTCIKEWECWIMRKKYAITMDLHFGPIIYMDGNPERLSTTNNTYLVVDQMAVLLPQVKQNTAIHQIDFLQHEDDLFGEITIDDTVQMFSLLERSTCTVIRNKRICLLGPHTTVDERETLKQEQFGEAPTLGDLHIIAEEMRASFVEAMYNDMMIRALIQRIMGVVNNLIKTESRYNNFVMNDILNEDVASYWTKEGIKTCSCLPSNKHSCEWTKSLLRTGKDVGGCTQEKLNYTEINLFGEVRLSTIMPEQLILKSVGKTIMETIEEKQMFEDKKATLKANSDSDSVVSFVKILGFNSVKEMIWEYLPLVNLVLIFFLIARTCR